MARTMTFDINEMTEMTTAELRRKSAYFPLADKNEDADSSKEIVQVPLEIYIALFLPFLLGFILTA